MSKFMDRDVAGKAFEFLRGDLEGMVFIDKNVSGFHVLILDPDATFTPQMSTIDPSIILFEYTYNPADVAGSRNKEEAEAIALLCLREKKDSQDVPPHLLRDGDIVHPGGVYLEGIVVVTTGLPHSMVQRVSLDIAEYCKSGANAKFEEWKKTHNKVAFVV